MGPGRSSITLAENRATGQNRPLDSLDRASPNSSTNSCLVFGLGDATLAAQTTGASTPNTWHPRPIERYYAAASPQHPLLVYHRLPQAAKCVQQLLATGKGRARSRRATNKKAPGNQFFEQSFAILRKRLKPQRNLSPKVSVRIIHCNRLCIKLTFLNKARFRDLRFLSSNNFCFAAC